MIKDVCKRCRSWTKDSKHGQFKCYCGDCPAKSRDENGRRSPGKVYFKPKTITIQIPYCPKCHKQISEVTDIDARTIMTWHCNNCHYSQ